MLHYSYGYCTSRTIALGWVTQFKSEIDNVSPENWKYYWKIMKLQLKIRQIIFRLLPELTCLHTHASITYSSMLGCVYIYIMSIYTYIHTHTRIHICIHYIHTHVYVCIYISSKCHGKRMLWEDWMDFIFIFTPKQMYFERTIFPRNSLKALHMFYP